MNAQWSLWEENPPEGTVRIKIAKKLINSVSMQSDRKECNSMYNKNVYKYVKIKRSEHMAVRTMVGWYLWTH